MYTKLGIQGQKPKQPDGIQFGGRALKAMLPSPFSWDFWSSCAFDTWVVCIHALICTARGGCTQDNKNWSRSKLFWTTKPNKPNHTQQTKTHEKHVFSGTHYMLCCFTGAYVNDLSYTQYNNSMIILITYPIRPPSKWSELPLMSSARRIELQGHWPAKGHAIIPRTKRGGGDTHT